MDERRERMRRTMRAIGRRAGLIVTVLVSMGIGALLYAAFSPGHVGQAATGPVAGEALAKVWTCSMHPDIRLSLIHI